jgi:hypothetical protein
MKNEQQPISLTSLLKEAVNNAALFKRKKRLGSMCLD